jgi:ABC-type phosphonate transport system ATPase subunit
VASIIDKAKEPNQGDLLEIEKYTNGLIRFIETSATPITIGIQGEWGSGKTSLLNTVRDELCDQGGAKHYPIWLNTWEFSLLSEPDETLIKIIIGLIDQIGELTKKDSEDSFKRVSLISKSLLARASKAGGVLGMAAGVASDAVDMNASGGNSIRELRESLQIVIDKAIEGSDRRAFIFFIDDLDRLDPTVAVSILELIKNLFDLRYCIFVLAIDYGVIIKGLQSKFGEMTEHNEWEFRAFFDKIIQLPFSMPISSYNISKYLKSLLVEVDYFSQEDLKNEKALNQIVEVVNLSVGTNPRALKRLANSVALIEIIRGDQEISSEERVIEFALICIQIAYPFIYGLIQRESDFTSWNEQTAQSILKSKKIDESSLAALTDTEEFDEVWEQSLWKICQVSSFLKERSFLLSRLLNFIKEYLPNVKNEEASETLDRLLSMSSVTSVSSDMSSAGSKERYQRVKYEGWDSYLNVLAEKKVPEEIIGHAKSLLDAITSMLGEDAQVSYTPSEINIKNNNALGRRKVFIYINIQKKQVLMSFFKPDEATKEKFPEGKYNEKSQSLALFLNKENNFDFQKYLPLISDEFQRVLNN